MANTARLLICVLFISSMTGCSTSPGGFWNSIFCCPQYGNSCGIDGCGMAGCGSCNSEPVLVPPSPSFGSKFSELREIRQMNRMDRINQRHLRRSVAVPSESSRSVKHVYNEGEYFDSCTGDCDDSCTRCRTRRERRPKKETCSCGGKEKRTKRRCSKSDCCSDCCNDCSDCCGSCDEMIIECGGCSTGNCGSCNSSFSTFSSTSGFSHGEEFYVGEGVLVDGKLVHGHTSFSSDPPMLKDEKTWEGKSVDKEHIIYNGKKYYIPSGGKNTLEEEDDKEWVAPKSSDNGTSQYRTRKYNTDTVLPSSHSQGSKQKVEPRRLSVPPAF